MSEYAPFYYRDLVTQLADRSKRILELSQRIVELEAALNEHTGGGDYTPYAELAVENVAKDKRIAELEENVRSISAVKNKSIADLKAALERVVIDRNDLIEALNLAQYGFGGSGADAISNLKAAADLAQGVIDRDKGEG